MSSQTASTVSDILQIISDLRGESSVNSDSSRIRAISRAEQDFADRMFWRTHLLRNQTATGDGISSDFTIGSTSYPMRPKGLTEVFVGGTTEDKRYGLTDYNRFTLLFNQNNNTHMIYEWYDAANDVWKMHLNPIPDAGAIITYAYYWTPPARTSGTDIVVCPDPMILAKGALAQIYDSEDETDKAIALKQEVEQIIDELKGLENSPAINQTYVMGAIENNVTNLGVGTY